MNKKLNCLIILVLTLFIGISFVSAEDNYKTVCKGMKGQELVNCCNKLTEKDQCKESAFNVCTKEKSLDNKRSCCENNYTNSDDVTDCKVYVERTCTTSDSVYLSRLASQIKATYEPVEDFLPDKPEAVYFMLNLKIFNLPPELALNVSSDKGVILLTYDKSQNGMFTIRVTDTTKIQKVVINVISNDVCYERVIRTITLTLPKYNQYSDNEICTDVPTYYLCQQYINFNVDGNKFLQNVKNYKAKIAKKEIESAQNDNDVKNNTINKTISAISSHKYVVVVIVLLVGCILTFLILKNNNKRKNDE